MKILKLEVSGFKRIRGVEITPDGSVVEITGKNEQGKSSVLDAIQAAFGGTRKAPTTPIRKGFDKAEIIVDTGEITVTRTFTKSGAALVVKGSDGVALKSPQAVLDKLYGSLTFDPLSFSMAEPREQVRILKGLTGLEEEFASIELEKQTLLSQKSAALQSRKRIEAQLEGLGKVEDGPLEPVDIAALSEEMLASSEWESQITKGDGWIKTQEAKIQGLETELERIKKELADARVQLNKGGQKLDELKTAGKRAVATIRAEITAASAENEIRGNRRLKAELKTSLSADTTAEKRAVRALEELEARKQEALANAKFPIKGLGFTEDGVTLGGVPFEQASTAQKIKASVAIGAALAPDLRVVLIREGSLLDTASLKELAKVAEALNLQVWMERVTDGQAVGVLIEDGEVSSVSPGASEGGVA